MVLIDITKAIDCLSSASSDKEYSETANLLILNLLCDGSTKNLSKAYSHVKRLLNSPFKYDYENQVSIFGQLMGIVAEDVQHGAVAPSIDNPPPGYIDDFVSLWSNYQKRHSRSSGSPEAELQMMHESYAYAHYVFLENYILEKLNEGYQGAYWAYGYLFLNQCNHLFHPVRKGSSEYDELERLFTLGINNNDLGALRAVIELTYAEGITYFFSNETVRKSIDLLKTCYQDKYESMISNFAEDGVAFP